ncbi:MAG TPA: DASS family sodium-coupled anion symporter [Longimicrobiaceae bacterium]|nr:DASS family sodium-coupled anion symporter [Longimicrobiaceae bacterium]
MRTFLDNYDGSPDVGRFRNLPWGLLIGLILFVVVLLLPIPGLSTGGQRVAAVTVLMATWWVTEAIPLPATGLLPIVLFPLFGVMSTGEATAPYANDLIFLFMGGFLLALAMQRWGLHRRIALGIVGRVGTGPRRLVLGFMIATGFLSMWVSNTATTVMMLPIGLAILALLEKTIPEEESGRLGTALMLGIAYAASIGGVATLIGTPPNAVFAGAVSELTGRTVGFVDWMIVGLPLSIVMLLVAWVLLVHILFRLPSGGDGAGEAARLIESERASLGMMNRGEKVVAVVFTLTACAWLVRAPKEIAGFEIPGIGSYFPLVSDSMIAIAAALVLFATPISLRERTFALDWEWASRIPWGVLLLFGGGLSLARGFGETDLSTWIGTRVEGLGALPPVLIFAAVAIIFIALSEFTSNTATATMAMPVMAGAGIGLGTDSVVLMATAALGSSLAFMMPVGTPPNAIVFGTGRVSIGEMMRAGFWLNLVSIILITFVAYSFLGAVFGV